MALSTSDPWTYETEENVIVCDQRGWDDATRAELERLMDQFRELASREDITASITIMDPDARLDSDTQAFLEQNSPVYDRLGIEKVALVSDGIQGLAAKSLVDTVPGTEIDTFDDPDAAVEWCKTS